MRQSSNAITCYRRLNVFGRIIGLDGKGVRWHLHAPTYAILKTTCGMSHVIPDSFIHSKLHFLFLPSLKALST